MNWSTKKLVSIQFLLYTLGGIAAFFAWLLILTENTSTLLMVAGSYMTWHFTRWTARLFLWGPLILLSAVLSLIAALLILRESRMGGYLGIISFSIGFVIDIVVANIMFVHVLIGLLIGWILLAPLIFGWKEIFVQQSTPSRT